MGGGSPCTRPHDRSYGSMAPSPATTEAAKPSPSSAHPFLPTRSSPTHPLPTMGGSAASAAGRAMPRSHQRLAFTVSTLPGFADKSPWVMKAVNAVAHELQCWYRQHSIRRYLARQTRRRLAATTLQCWKRRIWLDCWFAQQYLQRQKCLRLQLLCCGASAYAMSVWGDRRAPPTPTDKPSDPKVLHHPFRDRGLPLPQRRWAQQNNRPRCRPGRRNQPLAPDSGEGPLCMPLCFLATQTVVAASVLFVGATRSKVTPYLPPHSAASRIQLAYQSYVRRVSLHNNPTVPMIFARVILRILHSRCPFDCAVKSAYSRYIRWTKTNIDATYIRHGLNTLHQLCDKHYIKMDVESESLRGAVDVLSPVGCLDTSGRPVS
jgi:hypothetical protein